MQISDVTADSVPGWFGLSQYQWKVFLVTWLGWALDSTDFGLFSFVLRPAVTELLGGQADAGADRQPRRLSGDGGAAGLGDRRSRCSASSRIISAGSAPWR